MNNLWEGILNLKSSIREYEDTPITSCYLNLTTGEAIINKDLTDTTAQLLLVFKEEIAIPDKQLAIRVRNNRQLTFYNDEQLSTASKLFLKQYLPYCFLSIIAKQHKRAIAVAHFAQTLDGKIATENGDSKWIGNKENLLHAHRMRALCNGVVVGSNTLEIDAPKLTVRHVNGPDPTRIIIGNPPAVFDSLLESSTAPIHVFCSKPLEELSAVKYHLLSTENGLICPKEILKKLYLLNIHSVYIEGGAHTTSHFFEMGAIDILQLHIAPILFGSGTNGIQLPTINKVKEGKQFDLYHFLPVGDSMMFTGFNKI